MFKEVEIGCEFEFSKIRIIIVLKRVMQINLFTKLTQIFLMQCVSTVNMLENRKGNN